jgi:hypothetical protein
VSLRPAPKHDLLAAAERLGVRRLRGQWWIPDFTRRGDRPNLSPSAQ